MHGKLSTNNCKKTMIYSRYLNFNMRTSYDDKLGDGLKQIIFQFPDHIEGHGSYYTDMYSPRSLSTIL